MNNKIMEKEILSLENISHTYNEDSQKVKVLNNIRVVWDKPTIYIW